MATISATVSGLLASSKWEPIGRSLVRGILSLGLHGLATYMLLKEVLSGGTAEVPVELIAFVGVVIAFYFGTNENMKGQATGGAQALREQKVIRFTVRTLHAVGATGALSYLLISQGLTEIPSWWLTLYSAMLTFYFIELGTGMQDSP